MKSVRKKELRTIRVQKNALGTNEEIALKNKTIFGKAFVVNLLSSPGSGKTSLLEAVIPVLKDAGLKMAVIEGDVDTDLDKKRIDALGVPAYQIVTNGTCHLDARMVNNSLGRLDIKNADVIFIENVGNLVCPTSFNLGEDIKAVVLSVTEGDDKPLKYPAAFYKSRVLIINKTDLLPFLKADLERIIKNALSVNKDLKIFETSCYGIPKDSPAGSACDKGMLGFAGFIKESVRSKTARLQGAFLNKGLGI